MSEAALNDRNHHYKEAYEIIHLVRENLIGPMALAARLEAFRDAPRMLKEDDVEWIVNDIAELGVKIGDQFFFLYKGGSLVYGKDADSQAAGVCLNSDTDPPTKHMWRPVFKREFGECAHPINHQDYSKIGTVSLDDSDEWKPLPPPPTE